MDFRNENDIDWGQDKKGLITLLYIIMISVNLHFILRSKL